MAFDTWTPSVNPSLNSGLADNHRVLKSEFGDNYKQIVEDGLNAVFSNGTLTWSMLDQTAYDEIRAFWRAHGTATPFLWTPPDEATQRLWRFTETLSRTFLGPDIYSASVTIEEAFDLG